MILSLLIIIKIFTALIITWSQLVFLNAAAWTTNAVSWCAQNAMQSLLCRFEYAAAYVSTYMLPYVFSVVAPKFEKGLKKNYVGRESNP